MYTSVFLPEKSHGQRSLASYIQRDTKGHMTEREKKMKKYTLCFKVLLLPLKCFFLLQEMLIITSTA